jgi:hypothetical protein
MHVPLTQNAQLHQFQAKSLQTITAFWVNVELRHVLLQLNVQQQRTATRLPCCAPIAVIPQKWTSVTKATLANFTLPSKSALKTSAAPTMRTLFAVRMT